MTHELLFFLKIFLYLAVLDLCCGIQDLVPLPGIEPRPPALEVQSQPRGDQGSPWTHYLISVRDCTCLALVVEGWLVGRASMKSNFLKHLKQGTDALIEHVGCALLIAQLQPWQRHRGGKCVNPYLSVLTSGQIAAMILMRFGGDFSMRWDLSW